MPTSATRKPTSAKTKPTPGTSAASRTENTANADSPAGTATAAETQASIKKSFERNLTQRVGTFREIATTNDLYLALAHTVNEQLLKRWVDSAKRFYEDSARTVVYLSAEYLLGPQLGTNLLKLGILDDTREALRGIDVDLDAIMEHEEDPGLGNGGLGRLAACFVDSMATLGVPAIGYGIRYEFGIFDQEIHDGWQVELADKWLRKGNPWELVRHDKLPTVSFGGQTETSHNDDGSLRVNWLPEFKVRAQAHDTPVLGYGGSNANVLRLWHATATEGFDVQAFGRGDYFTAVENKVRSETISKQLYPDDTGIAGKRLRLQQQHFFVSASLQDLMRIYAQKPRRIEDFHKKFVIQLNDTHPALAVAELMRLLLDQHGLPWRKAWDITRKTLNYTNHTLLPEALETWSLPMFQEVLPRTLEIIYEINKRFLDEVRARFPGDEDRVRRMSIIDEHGERRVRMAHLAVIGSSMVNGVAELHSKLLTQTVLKDFAEMWPERFTNVTNGVTPRRFVALANTGLSKLITETVGDGWVTQLDKLQGLEKHIEDAAFRDRWRQIKVDKKRELAGYLSFNHGVNVNPDTLFDMQFKRIHEYKRQHMMVLFIISELERALRGEDVLPRTFMFGGKAAPGYRMAKLIIRLIHGVGEVIDAHPQVREKLRVFFLPDFNVKHAQPVYPAADLSEQISMAGKEASGTGNMKFALNGALTIGTLDGANIEIRDAVGPENFFHFGMTTDEVRQKRSQGYFPHEVLDADPGLQQIINRIAAGDFSRGDKAMFAPLVDNLVHHDPFMALADFRAYDACQQHVATTYQDQDQWTRMSIYNSARMGYFSSDRSIRNYCERIWGIAPHT